MARDYAANDRRSLIGYAHFLKDGEPYRVAVLYSLNYGAVTAVSFERGFSQVDAIFNGINNALRPTMPYFDLSLANVKGNPLRLGNGDAIQINNVDRAAGLLDIMVATFNDAGEPIKLRLQIPGQSITNNSGYLRQTGGEQFEFIPAYKVTLYGRETRLTVYLEEETSTDAQGRPATVYPITSMVQSNFKGSIELCPGLPIKYGDNIEERIKHWSGTRAERMACEIVFNRSGNGKVLTGVASIAKKVSFETANGRAVSAAIWRYTKERREQ